MIIKGKIREPFNGIPVPPDFFVSVRKTEMEKKEEERLKVAEKVKEDRKIFFAQQRSALAAQEEREKKDAEARVQRVAAKIVAMPVISVVLSPREAALAQIRAANARLSGGVISK